VWVRLNTGLGAAALNRGLFATADMPHSENINCFRGCAVVNEIPDPAKQETANTKNVFAFAR